jgi:hypothetical protein
VPVRVPCQSHIPGAQKKKKKKGGEKVEVFKAVVGDEM